MAANDIHSSPTRVRRGGNQAAGLWPAGVPEGDKLRRAGAADRARRDTGRGRERPGSARWRGRAGVRAPVRHPRTTAAALKVPLFKHLQAGTVALVHSHVFLTRINPSLLNPRVAP
jgi:hypothetical protein